MNGRRLEHAGLAGEQAMSAARLAQQNAPPEAELTAARIGPHLAAGRRDGNLQPPTAAEERHAGRKYGLGELDLTRDRRAAVVDIERRAGHGDAVVMLETNAGRKTGFGVRRGHNVDRERRVDTAQYPCVAGSRVIAERGDLPGANLGDVAVDDQDRRGVHAAPAASPRVPFTAARKMRSRAAASTGIGLPPADGSIAASRPMISALSALTPMAASECGMPSSRRISSTQARKPS